MFVWAKELSSRLCPRAHPSPSHNYDPWVPSQGLNLPCDPPCRPAAYTSPTLPRHVKCGCWCCSTHPRKKYSWASSLTTRAASSTASGKSSPTTSRSSSTERWVVIGGGRGAGGERGRFQCGDQNEVIMRRHYRGARGNWGTLFTALRCIVIDISFRAPSIFTAAANVSHSSKSEGG